MKWKWIVCIAVLNFAAIFIAASSLLVDFAILAPKRLQYDIGNSESVRRAIFQAESQGIEMMRGSALVGGATLALVMLLNFLVLCLLLRTKKSAAH